MSQSSGTGRLAMIQCSPGSLRISLVNSSSNYVLSGIMGDRKH